jgi:hypothetical protein
MKSKRRNPQKQGTAACPDSGSDGVQRTIGPAARVPQAVPAPLFKYSTGTRRLPPAGNIEETPLLPIFLEDLSVT